MLAVILSCALATQSEPQKEKEFSTAAKKELKALEGKWKLVGGVSSKGMADEDSKVPEMFAVFRGAELTFASGTKKESTKITALDPTTDPKCIDLTEKRRDGTERTIECVYKIEKGTLHLALGIVREGKYRPFSFEKPKDDRTIIWSFQRVKE